MARAEELALKARARAAGLLTAREQEVLRQSVVAFGGHGVRPPAPPRLTPGKDYPPP
ncbi:hypothetical protein STVIR_8065 [Streptomyces viridochromogenes Tue57]|uniref:Uncharacterized protein n=1 Tax=Streptomyces viridochromogenes Tue57 TaxID=1160705 RepID=L8P3C5_STRVR|nr:hypothetical protein STVIR_8065 [Streptomyces viridochromogenes Tue57]